VWRLLGLVTVRQREDPLSSFRGVRFRQCGHSDEVWWQVGLVHGSGKFIVVQWFGGGTETEAPAECQSYGTQLAQITGLPVLHETPAA
jgi:hypothetical protein